MRKMYIKTGLLLVMACLSLLAAGFISSGDALAYHRPHSRHVRSHVHRPYIVLKMLPNSGQYYNHQYVVHAVIYGVGFENCSNCGSDQGTSNPCDTGCTPPPTPSDTPPPCDTGCTPPPAPSDTPSSPCDTGCSTSHQEVTDQVTTTDVQTTTTTTTSTNVTHHNLGCTSGCSTPLPPNTVPCTPCNSSNYNNARNNNNYNNARNNNNYNATPAPNATCPSYNACGTGSNDSNAGSTNDSSAGPNDSNAGPNDSGSGCDCNSGNTANLQGNVPFTAPGVNVSQVPVNTFGEFRVGVNIRMTPRQARTRPSFWATNSYNRQRSDSTPAPCCSSAFCCQ